MSNISPRIGITDISKECAGHASSTPPGRTPSLAGLAVLLALTQSPLALAATAPSLGTAANFGIASTTFTNNSNPTVVNGSVCYTTAPVTPPTTITGATVVPCAAAVGVDQGAALANLNGQACVSLGGGAIDLSAANIGSGPGVFTPGCYSSGGAMSVGSGTITLTGTGVFIFRSAGTLTTANNTNMAVGGGACAADVFWAPNGATTLGANTTFVGNILDGVANAVTMGNLTSVTGRVLSFGGTVTTTSNTITLPSACAVAAATSAPTLSEWGLIILSGLMVLFGLAQVKRRSNEMQA